MAKERVFEEDKVYLKGPDDQIWPYEALLAEVVGYEKVIPNPSKSADTETEEELDN